MDELSNAVDNISLEENDLPIHESNEAIIVHPNGQTQVVNECWCKIYHVFGNQISFEHVNEMKFQDDIFCMSISESCSFFKTLPFHIVFFQKFGISKNGPIVFYKKGFSITIQETQNLFNR